MGDYVVEREGMEKEEPCFWENASGSTLLSHAESRFHSKGKCVSGVGSWYADRAAGMVKEKIKRGGRGTPTYIQVAK